MTILADLYSRSLTLILRPDDVTYTDDVTQVVDSKHFEPDLKHLYHGHVKGTVKINLNSIRIVGYLNKLQNCLLA